MSEKKFKVGDRLIVMSDTRGYNISDLIGKEGIVKSSYIDPNENTVEYAILDDAGDTWHVPEEDVACASPATPTAQWQKEAEEMYDTYYSKELIGDRLHRKPNISYEDAAVRERKAHIKASELRHAEHQKELAAKDQQHTAYKEQVQREVDEIIKPLIEAYNIIIKDSFWQQLPHKLSEIEDSLTRLRTITKTQPQDKK